eukprot:gene662-1279_t
MPLFLLKIKADLENVKQLMPVPDNNWQFNVKSMDGEVREGITFSSSDSIDLEGSRGTANFIMRWKGSREQCYIKVVDVKKCDGTYKIDDSGNFVTILGLECRGLEPLAWLPSTDFIAETNNGKFMETDLSDNDWTDFDDEYDEPISVLNLEYKIE